MTSTSPEGGNIRPHPLARALIERLPRSAAVLEIGSGRGRNTAALTAAGFFVHAIADADIDGFTAPDRLFDGALSTHGFLHGTPQSLDVLLRRVAASLEGGAPLYATFASTNDARYGHGVKIADETYAAESGDEAGVPHVFFGEGGLRVMLSREFIVEDCTQTGTDAIVGTWAHETAPRGYVHWFVRARRR
jgi:hypothetical protein